MISLVVKPAVTLAWEEYRTSAPKFSLALDGYVPCGPCFDSEKMVAVMNHHEGCDRLATRATCAQVLMAIRQGMFSSFRDESGTLEWFEILQSRIWNVVSYPKIMQQLCQIELKGLIGDNESLRRYCLAD